MVCQVQPFTRRPYLYTPSPPYHPPILQAAVQQPILLFFCSKLYQWLSLPMTCRMTIPSSPTPFHGNPKQCCLITINREMLNRHCHGIMPPPEPPICSSMRYGSDVIVIIQAIVNTVQNATDGIGIDTPLPKRMSKRNGLGNCCK